ncbi:MAG: hypothetical protein KKD63_09215 [Proteobacteria bacterium]|nr:hypothetical protein [Pseudomonadota bacterium]
MKMNRIQFQQGLSLNQFLAQYGKEQQCEYTTSGMNDAQHLMASQKV